MDKVNQGLTAASAQFTNASQFLTTDNPNPALQVLRIVLLVGVIYLVLETLKSIYVGYSKWARGSPYLLAGTKDAKKRMLVLQDPSKSDSTTLYRSENEFEGLEFSYMMWMYIDDWSYKYGEWKHVLHKGNESSWPNRAPGIWLHPKENKLRVYMNTYKKISEFTDIDGLPLNKWFHLVVAVRQQNLDIYINGNLAKSHTMESIAKQNYGDVYINALRGFGGFMSNIRYYDYYCTYSDIDGALQLGPAKGSCVDTTDLIPPYFVPNWWANKT
jgi:hypothetical protein